MSTTYTIIKVKRGQSYTLDTGETKVRLGGDVFAVVDDRNRVVTTRHNQHTYERKHAAASALRSLVTPATLKVEGPTPPHAMPLRDFAERHVAEHEAAKSAEAAALRSTVTPTTPGPVAQAAYAEATAVQQGWASIHAPAIREVHAGLIRAAIRRGETIPPNVLADHPALENEV